MAVQLSITEQLTYSTVRLEARLPGGRSSIGTGFFYRFLDEGEQHVPALVTNKHVVSGATEVTFFVHEAAGSDPHPSSISVTLPGDAGWIPHPDPLVDLTIIPIAALARAAAAQGNQIFYRALDPSLVPSPAETRDLTAVEDILMIGYPIGIWDSVNNMPVCRTGVTATHPGIDYEGRTEFMIDAACFPGSSGSPVLLFNLGTYPSRNGGVVVGTRIKLLGALYAGPQFTASGEIAIEDIPTAQTLVATSRIPANLGLVVKAHRLVDFEPILSAIRSSGSSTA
jgi:hypothetical protein